jgi:hypothetical protein
VIIHGCRSICPANNPIYLARERIHIPAIGAAPPMVTIPTSLARSARVRHARDIKRVRTAAIRLTVSTGIRTTWSIIQILPWRLAPRIPNNLLLTSHSRKHTRCSLDKRRSLESTCTPDRSDWTTRSGRPRYPRHWHNSHRSWCRRLIDAPPARSPPSHPIVSTSRRPAARGRNSGFRCTPGKDRWASEG